MSSVGSDLLSQMLLVVLVFCIACKTHDAGEGLGPFSSDKVDTYPDMDFRPCIRPSLLHKHTYRRPRSIWKIIQTPWLAIVGFDPRIGNIDWVFLFRSIDWSILNCMLKYFRKRIESRCEYENIYESSSSSSTSGPIHRVPPKNCPIFVDSMVVLCHDDNMMKWSSFFSGGTSLLLDWFVNVFVDMTL